MANLTGKVALVTGATRGIGKGIAIGLGEAGATVYITGRSLGSQTGGEIESGTLQATQAAVAAAGGTCIAVATDHGDDEQVQALFERIAAEQNGQLDILVNNAYGGVQVLKEAYGTPFWKLGPELWDAGNNVGLRSHYVASIYAARLMVPRKQGLICTISSWGGLSYIFGVAYGTGKAACDRLAADMAVELQPHNVTSLALWPGIVGTELLSAFFQEMAGETPSASAIRDRYNWETPLFVGRVIAALVADPQASRWTGRLRIVAELAQRYRVEDENGQRPASLRSLRFVLPFAIPALRRYAQWVPDWRLPWWVMQTTALSAPKL